MQAIDGRQFPRKGDCDDSRRRNPKQHLSWRSDVLASPNRTQVHGHVAVTLGAGGPGVLVQQAARAIAWRTLALTTVNLTLAFAAWFLVSALVVRLPQVGYTFTPSQLFWLTAMPGLAGGTLRLVHMFLTPDGRYPPGGQPVHPVPAGAAGRLVLRGAGSKRAVLDADAARSFLAGLGGGNFSSFMPSTSLFFPKRLQGTALAIQAGIGNLGVSIVQFVTPWIIGVALLGGAAFMGDSQTLTKNGVESQVHLQNAAAVMIPFTWWCSASAPG
jgi:NNP family nitrate/nitrite transporter-like MFS transporter